MRVIFGERRVLRADRITDKREDDKDSQTYFFPNTPTSRRGQDLRD